MCKSQLKIQFDQGNESEQEIDSRQQDIDRLKMRLAAMQELHHVPAASKKPAEQPATLVGPVSTVVPPKP